jgi:AraC-like DNA-binding protein
MISPNILYSCYVTRNLSNEQFIPEHIFLYQFSGSLIINDANKEYSVQTGEFCLARINCLAKYIKLPPENGEYKTVSVRLDQTFLKAFSKEFGYTAEQTSTNDAIIKIQSEPLLLNYVNSLTPYFDLEKIENEPMLILKTKEAVLLLLKTNPELKNILFDFSDPGKIDLEAFMNRNFQFNVSMERFGYMSGRSLSTFKRDFKKIFKISPGRWLLQKRLQQAYYLITKKGQKPSNVYLEVGFEDISHFSRSFRKQFGVAPSKV